MIKYDNGNYELNEAYRSIRTFIAVDERLKTILVTSAEMDEGKSTGTANMARCFSELEDKKTIVIDCDFRKKGLNEQFEISRDSPGLSNLMYNGKQIDECIKKEGNLDILTCGTIHCNPSVLLELDRTKSFINSLRDKYDYIFIDSPPILRVNDACIIAQYADGTVLVSASKEIDKNQVKATKDRLEKVNANIVGVVLNKFQSKGNKIYSYYGYEDESPKKKGLFKRKRR
ncbi:MAG: CpsD/CapB family tyrosine-protein kinase [Terrisporobacter sp.]